MMCAGAEARCKNQRVGNVIRMIQVLVNWLYIIITTYLTGNACMRLLERLFRKDRGTWHRTPFYDLFAGIMCTTCYAQVYSLFGGVGLGAGMCLLVFCAVYALLYGRDIAGGLGSYLHRVRNELPSPVFKGLVCILALGAAAYALASSGAPRLIDTDWYHAQTIRWIEEYGCVKGVANLFYALGFNSAQHYFDALYSMKPFLGVSMHATGGYFGLLLLAHGLVRLAGFKAHRRHIADALALAEVVYTVIVTAFYADPYTDTLPNCLVFFILTEWIILLEEEEKEVFPYAFLCIFGVFATVVKTSVVMVVLLAIQPAVSLIRGRKWGLIVGYILTGILVTIPFFITNVRVSGYLVYLASGVDLFDVPWKIDAGVVKYSVDSMIHDARGVSLTMDEALHSGLSWVPGWFKSDSVSHRILYLAVCLMLVSDIVETVISVIRKKPVAYAMLLPRLVVFTGLVYWFFTIPQVKYCWVFLLFPLVVVPAVRLEKWKASGRAGRMAAVLTAAAGGAVLVMFAGFYSLRTLGYIRDAVPQMLVKQADYERHTLEPVEIGGHTFYVCGDDGDIVSGYYAFPYINEESALNGLNVGASLRDGFTVNISGSF